MRSAPGAVMLSHATMPGSLFDKSLLYVTGKGGVGKTTVAAALGLAAAGRGKRTIVCEVAEQDRMSRAFAREGVGREVEVQLAPNLFAISIDPQLALEEWLSRQLGHLGAGAVKTLLRSSAFQYFVAAAPGAKELITIAKVWELAQLERWDRHHRPYDLVVVDAPASGHGVAMLATPRTYAGIAGVGRIKRSATRVADQLADPERTGYLAVALPEEMPVTETLELGGRLREAVGLGLDAVIVNGLFEERYSPDEAERLHRLARDDGLGGEALDEAEPTRRTGRDSGLEGEALDAIRAALSEHERARAQRAHLDRLRSGLEEGVDLLTLPFLFEPDVGLEQYGKLAREIDLRL